MKKETICLLILFGMLFSLSACQQFPPPSQVGASMPAPEIDSALAALTGQEGLVELRIRLGSETGQECVKSYPFSLREQEGRLLLSGQDVKLDCHFSKTFCDTDCVTLHVLFDMDTRVDGEVILTENETQPTLKLYFFYDGELLEYYSDAAQGVSSTFTENKPLVVPAGDFASASMAFAQDSRAVLLGEEGQIPPDTLPIGIDAMLWQLTLYLY